MNNAWMMNQVLVVLRVSTKSSLVGSDDALRVGVVARSLTL
jgi:hypothetical protein